MPTKTKHRIILDTNLWISFLLTDDFEKLDTFINNDKIELLFNNELVEEFTDVAQRPKFRKYFTVEDLQGLLKNINSIAIFIETHTEVTLCRDPKDNFLLSLAIDGKADYLITGDKDLLALKKMGNTKIITLSEYLKIL